MTFRHAIGSALHQYAKFSGRTGLMEYWYWILFVVVATIAARILDALLFSAFDWASPLSDLFTLATFIPSLAAAVRRLHDVDRRGWWLLLIFVPLIGILLLIVWSIEESSPGDNRFGSAPVRAPANAISAG
jgi:uncharacterized membrane protein YhaH (DUF805 family)